MTVLHDQQTENVRGSGRPAPTVVSILFLVLTITWSPAPAALKESNAIILAQERKTVCKVKSQ